MSKKKTNRYTDRMRGRVRLASACALGLCLTAGAATDGLTVAASETANVTASQANATVDVHGSLSVRGGTKDATVQLSVATALNVGRAEGDNASVTVGDYGQILGQASVTIGGLNGAGLVTLGGKRKGDIDTANENSYSGDSAHLFCGVITVPENATAASGTLDILHLDENGALVQSGSKAKIQNLSSSCEARILFNGGSLSDANGWGGAKQFASTGGKALILESENAKPISLRYQYGAVCEPTEGLVKTAGAGDVVVTGKTWTEGQGHYGWRLTDQGFVWGHTGDLRLSAAMCLVCASANVLPCLENGGDVVLDGGRPDNWLDLAGTAQAVNGLTVVAPSVVSNSAATAATLTFGSARPDGTLNAPLVLGQVNVEKVGTGTLTITNTPTLAALTVTGGTVRFAPSDGLVVNLSALTVAANAKVVIDGVTVRANALALDPSASIDALNGGRLAFAEDATTARTFVDGGQIPAGSSIEKTGAGTTVFVEPGQTELKDVHVRGGVLALAARGTTNEFWRVTIKETAVAGVNLNVGPFRLFDADGAYCDGGIMDGSFAWSDGLFYAKVDVASATALGPKQIMFSSDDFMEGDYNEVKHGSDAQMPPQKAMFSDSTICSCSFNFAPVISDPSTWLVATYRIPALGGKVVAGYNVKSQWDDPTRKFPGAWTVESSPSGEDGTWEVLDEQVGQKAANGNRWYRTAPYPVLADMPTAGLPTGANVQVDAGATLDCVRVAGKQEISCLTVDWSSSGVGTLKGVRLAAVGTLHVTGVTGKKAPKGMLPLAFVDSVLGEDLSGWTVFLNGVRVNRRLMGRGDALELVAGGFAVILR